MTMPMAETALYDLMTWMSPTWPIGAFAHSSGLEWAVEQGHVVDRASTADWITTLIERGAIHNDLVLFTHAWRAADTGDHEELLAVAELAVASQTGFERRLEATAQGAAFRRIATATVAGDLLAGIDDDDLTYPVAAAALFAAQGIALRPALTAWLHGAAANLVSAAQRLVPLGQTDGQKVLRELREPIFAAVEAAIALPEGDPFEALGGAALVAELGCMAHETQYTRLFRT
jgi:urease accessory protein